MSAGHRAVPPASARTDDALRGLAERIEPLLARPAPASSAHERFQQLLAHAAGAVRAGAYGIAACLVIRDADVELTLFGANGLTLGDPRAHAEMNAVALAVEVLRLDRSQRRARLHALQEDGRAIVRRTERPGPSTELFTTMEPCPMCTVGAVINARVARVTYAQEDDQTGTLDRARLQGLPPLWPRAAREQGLEVVACQGERPAERDSYVPPDLLAALGEVFLVNREPLDRMLEREGFFRPAELLADLPVSAR